LEGGAAVNAYEQELMLSGETDDLPTDWKPGASRGLAPELRPDAEALWDAWESLCWSRPVGFGMGAIPVSEVLAYCTLLGIRDLDERERILGAVQRLDAEFLKYHAEQAKQK
jgi:hypothetical protein